MYLKKLKSLNKFLRYTPRYFSIQKHLNSNDNSHSRASTAHYDIAIAGGGMVGTTLACALGKSNCLKNRNILLLEGSPPFKKFDTEKPFGNRVSALNHGTAKLMESIDVWDKIKSLRYKSVKQMQVWDASSNASICFNADNFAKDVAYIVENDLILDAVMQELTTCENVCVKHSSKILSVKFIQDVFKQGWIVDLADDVKVTCDLLIGADGANSLVRNEMGITYYSENYNQMGLVATLEIEDMCDGNTVAWQRFIPTGPLALLPLNDTVSSLVWTTTPDQAKKLNFMPPDDFVHAVNEAFVKEYPKDSFTNYAINCLETLVGGTSGIKQLPPRVKKVLDNSRACFPLGFGHASSYVNHNVALIGDAAHRVHPLAGQGVNLGFGDVTCLIQVINEAISNGGKIGDLNYLLKYEKERLTKNLPIMLGIHGIQNLYNTTFGPVVLLRSLGLQITQNAPFLKKVFMERAMG